MSNSKIIPENNKPIINSSQFETLLNTTYYNKQFIYDKFSNIPNKLIHIDIIIVTYNSRKWLHKLLKSYNNLSTEFCNVTLTFVDNNSTDDTIELLETLMQEYSLNFTIIKNPSNKGFGAANNLGAKNTKSEFIFFLNVDTELHSNTLDLISKNILISQKEFVVFELKQTPYEHPKYFNPITQETSWFSGAAVVIKRSVFETLDGFDEELFMYAEDVDLSWRIRNLGYKIKYLYDCSILHHTYSIANEIKPLQAFYSKYHNLLLRYRYGNFICIIKGYFLIFLVSVFKKNPSYHFINIKKIYRNSFKKGIQFRKGFSFKNNNFVPHFYIFDYERRKDGGFYINEEVRNEKYEPIISIIVRTHNRKNVLRENLISLRNQSYQNFEVIISEDGQNTAQEIIETEFTDLNIIYNYTKKNVGRSVAGNIALSLCNGEFINFLDDDDLFYPDHLEILVNEINKNKSLDVIQTTSFETAIDIISNSPYKYEVTNISKKYSYEFNRELLLQSNQFPIQTILFRKNIYLNHGGI